jgi:hypothetical protein
MSISGAMKWRCDRITLVMTACARAPSIERLPPLIFRTTTAGLMALSAR